MSVSRRCDRRSFPKIPFGLRFRVRGDGKMTPAASDAYQKVLMMSGHLKQAVAFDNVFTNKYLPS